MGEGGWCPDSRNWWPSKSQNQVYPVHSILLFFFVVFVCFLFLFFCFFLFLDQISIIKTNMVKAEGYAYIIESLKPCYARVHAQSKARTLSRLKRQRRG